MLKISFTNAEVSDHGYGLEVNGKSLEDIISTALGTKLKGKPMRFYHSLYFSPRYINLCPHLPY